MSVVNVKSVSQYDVVCNKPPQLLARLAIEMMNALVRGQEPKEKLVLLSGEFIKGKTT